MEGGGEGGRGEGGPSRSGDGGRGSAAMTESAARGLPRVGPGPAAGRPLGAHKPTAGHGQTAGARAVIWADVRVRGLSPLYRWVCYYAGCDKGGDVCMTGSVMAAWVWWWVWGCGGGQATTQAMTQTQCGRREDGRAGAVRCCAGRRERMRVADLEVQPAVGPRQRGGHDTRGSGAGSDGGAGRGAGHEQADDWAEAGRDEEGRILERDAERRDDGGNGRRTS